MFALTWQPPDKFQPGMGDGSRWVFLCGWSSTWPGLAGMGSSMMPRWFVLPKPAQNGGVPSPSAPQLAGGGGMVTLPCQASESPQGLWKWIPGSMPDVNPLFGAKLWDFGDISQVEGSESLPWYSQGSSQSSTGFLLDHPKPLPHWPPHTRAARKTEIEK